MLSCQQYSPWHHTALALPDILYLLFPSIWKGEKKSCFESIKAKYALMWNADFKEAATRNVCFWHQWDQGLFLKPKVVGQLGHQFSGQEKELLLQATLEKAPIMESDLWRKGSGHRASTSRSFPG